MATLLLPRRWFGMGLIFAKLWSLFCNQGEWKGGRCGPGVSSSLHPKSGIVLGRSMGKVYQGSGGRTPGHLQGGLWGEMGWGRKWCDGGCGCYPGVMTVRLVWGSSR